jgi:hypothetical protein
MCNLYSITTNQAAIAALFRVVNRYVGNLAPMPGVFPEGRGPSLMLRIRIIAGVIGAFVVLSARPASATPALDADMASFRADPQAWVRNNILPGCTNPFFLDVPACDCQVKAIIRKMSEADVARGREAIRVKVDLPTISFFCMKAQTPP